MQCNVLYGTVMWCDVMLCYVMYIYTYISPQQSLQKTLSGASPSSFQLSTAGAVAVLAVAQRRRSCLRWVTLSHSPRKQRDPLRGVKDEHILTDTRESRCLTPEKTAASPEIHLYVILSYLLQQWLLHSTDIFTNMTQFSRYVYMIIWSTRST